MIFKLYLHSGNSIVTGFLEYNIATIFTGCSVCLFIRLDLSTIYFN